MEDLIWGVKVGGLYYIYDLEICVFNLADNGYIEGKELDEFFRHMMKRLGPQVKLSFPFFFFP